MSIEGVLHFGDAGSSDADCHTVPDDVAEIVTSDEPLMFWCERLPSMDGRGGKRFWP